MVLFIKREVGMVQFFNSSSPLGKAQAENAKGRGTLLVPKGATDPASAQSALFPYGADKLVKYNVFISETQHLPLKGKIKSPGGLGL